MTIDKSTGKLKVIVPPFLFEVAKKMFGKEYVNRHYLKNQYVKNNR